MNVTPLGYRITRLRCVSKDHVGDSDGLAEERGRPVPAPGSLCDMTRVFSGKTYKTLEPVRHVMQLAHRESIDTTIFRVW